MVLDIIFVLSIKFFVFDFVNFKPIRDNLLKLQNYFISKLLKCPFCQGFWLGLITHSLKYNESLANDLYFGFITAIICLCWNVIFWPLIDNYEETYDN